MKDPMSEEEKDQQPDTADKSADGEAPKKPNPFKRLTTDGWDIPDLMGEGTDDAAPEAPAPLTFDSEPEEAEQSESSAEVPVAQVPDSEPEDNAEPADVADLVADQTTGDRPDEEADDAEDALAESLTDAEEGPQDEVAEGEDEVAEETAERSSEAPSAEPIADSDGAHRWFLAACLATAVVVILFISLSGSWQPYYCKTTYGPMVELLEEQPADMPRWLPSEDCRGLKECINGFCRSPEVWNRTSLVGRFRTIILDLDPI